MQSWVAQETVHLGKKIKKGMSNKYLVYQDTEATWRMRPKTSPPARSTPWGLLFPINKKKGTIWRRKNDFGKPEILPERSKQGTKCTCWCSFGLLKSAQDPEIKKVTTQNVNSTQNGKTSIFDRSVDRDSGIGTVVNHSLQDFIITSSGWK